MMYERDWSTFYRTISFLLVGAIYACFSSFGVAMKCQLSNLINIVRRAERLFFIPLSKKIKFLAREAIVMRGMNFPVVESSMSVI